MKTTAKTDMEIMRSRHQNLQKLCKEQGQLIQLLQAQLKHKEMMLEASDKAIKHLVLSRQKEEQLM